MRLVLGLNTDHGDASAVLLGERGLIAAIAEERLNRQKHSARFPSMAIREVLRIGGADIRDVTDIAVARDPRANLLPKALFAVTRSPKHIARLARMRLRVHQGVLSTRDRIARALDVDRQRIPGRFHTVEHHLAHVASSFYWSPFDRCAGFSVDGAGDFATTMWADCRGNEIRVIGRTHWPHSLGVFYTAICQFLGFDRYGEEYKVMGLSAYGENTHADVMKDMVRFREREGLRLNLRYFRHHYRRDTYEFNVDGEIRLPIMWGRAMSDALGPPRDRKAPITDRERALAASMQVRYEDVFLSMVDALVERTGQRRLVMAGGCALNSVANGRMLTEAHAEQAYFQPAASDDGTALGAALYVLHGIHGLPRTESVGHAYWGTQWDETEIEKSLQSSGRPYQRLSRDQLLDTAARAVAEGKVVGWFQGREEWGPRALGNRSILCNPAIPDMKATLNARIKNREPFRPFAPVVREEDLPTCFEGSHPVPFMIIVYKVRPEWRPRLPAITHEDGTGRVQTIRREDNSLYYDLIGRHARLTGIPVLLNTSFNENEPIVHTPEQAVGTFTRTKMDCLGIGPFWLEKKVSTLS